MEERSQIGTTAPDVSGTQPHERAGFGRRRGPSLIARFAGFGALAIAIALVAIVILANGSSYTLRLTFADASGLVTGDDVLIGPARVGSIQSIGLTPDGSASVVIALHSDAAPMPEGTVAHIYENSLSGIASHYVVLQPGPSGAPSIRSGGTIGEDRTYSEVSLDQLFDALDPLTRVGIKGLIRGEGASIQGRAQAANRTLQYLAPALSSTSNVTAELTRSEPAFDGLLVQGARTLQALASRSDQLSELVSNTNATVTAIANQSQPLEQALTLLPGALTHSTTTFAGLRSTLDALTPFVQASKPASRRLEPFSVALRELADVSIPTLGELSALIHGPAATGDLTRLLQQTPSLSKLATSVFPRVIRELNFSQPQLDYLREYAPDVVASLTNLGQAGAYYDANGHYTRTQPVFGAFGLNGVNQLVPQLPSARYNGLQVVHARCPGGAVQPSPDGSAPNRVPGCNPASTPPGP